jgi:hypothetical protein
VTDKTRELAKPGPNRPAKVSALSDDELRDVSGGTRKSGGGKASGVIFPRFTFNLVAVR